MTDPPTPHYEIRLHGQLDAGWAAWFDGWDIVLDEAGHTCLRGPAADQPALHGVLKKVRDLGLPLLAVNLVASPTPPKELRMTTNRQALDAPHPGATLSTLWICVVFCIAFADIIGFLEPGTLEKIIRGELGFELTPALIVVFSLLQAVPIAMIALARWAPRAVNRWLNLGASALTLLYVLGGGNWESASYFVFAALEVATLLGIAWLAWTWHAAEA